MNCNTTRSVGKSCQLSPLIHHIVTGAGPRFYGVSGNASNLFSFMDCMHNTQLYQSLFICISDYIHLRYNYDFLIRIQNPTEYRTQIIVVISWLPLPKVYMTSGKFIQSDQVLHPPL